MPLPVVAVLATLTGVITAQLDKVTTTGNISQFVLPQVIP
jgi:hypothetical protein